MSTASEVAGGLARNPVVGGVLVLAVVGGIVWWRWGDDLRTFFKGAGKVGGAVGDAVNPLSRVIGMGEKIVRGAKAVGSAVSDEHWTLGGAIYDILRPYDPNAPAKTNHLIANSDVDGRPSSLR
jgi:hypothetical protein